MLPRPRARGADQLLASTEIPPYSTATTAHRRPSKRLQEPPYAHLTWSRVGSRGEIFSARGRSIAPESAASGIVLLLEVVCVPTTQPSGPWLIRIASERCGIQFLPEHTGFVLDVGSQASKPTATRPSYRASQKGGKVEGPVCCVRQPCLLSTGQPGRG